MRHRRPLPEPVLRRLADRATDYGLSRRAFLGLLGVAGGASALAGCTVGDAPSSVRGQGGMPGYLRWANWEYYIDRDDDGNSPTLDKFKDQTGIDVLYYEDINDLDTFYDQVRGRLSTRQDIGYDVITLSDWCVKQWADRADLSPLDRAAMPNTQHLRKDLQGLYFDPDLKYSIPWQQGITVVAWNKAAVPDGISSVKDLWDPKYKGKVAIVSELRETMGAIMKSLGTDPAEKDWGDAEFNQALDVLRTAIAQDQILSVKGGDIVTFLSEGKAEVAIAYGGDVAFESDTCGFAIPDEGATYWVDNLIAPATTNQVSNVEKFINFYYDPEVAATVSAYTYYGTPVTGAKEAMEKINPAEVDNSMIFPTDAMLAKLSNWRELTAEESARYGKEFKDLIAFL